MTTKQRYDGVIAWFSEHMPVAESELHYTDPYQLLVAVILSAQCTDKRVNMTTPALFEAFPELAPEHVADARDLFVESALAILPLHAAASLSDLADSVCDLTLRALRPQSSETSAIPLPRRISEAEEALRIGAGLR